MNKHFKPTATSIMTDIRYQITPGRRTLNPCECGQWRRGNLKCPDCLVIDLSKIVGRDLAVRYLAAIKVELDIEGQILEKAGE